MAFTSGESETAAGTETTFSAVHPGIILSHIFTRLDGPTLASVASTCSQLRDLSSDEQLWAKACHSTWPSTMDPLVRHVISTLPIGYRSFFADSYPTSRPSATITTTSISLNYTSELISAVDLFHGDRLILSEVMETKTVLRSFRPNPFWIKMTIIKDMVLDQISYTFRKNAFRDLKEELRLRWIVIDPLSRGAMNMSSQKAVSIAPIWLSSEVQVEFSTVVNSVRWTGTETETQMTLVKVVVMLGGGNLMHVTEVFLQTEDMDGKVLDGLVILKRALESERNKKENVGEGYSELMKRKAEKRKINAGCPIC